MKPIKLSTLNFQGLCRRAPRKLAYRLLSECSRSSTTQLLISCVLAVAVLIGCPVGASSQDIDRSSRNDIVEHYDTIPDIALYDTLGNIHHLQELKGKYLLLDFWHGNNTHIEASFSELKKLKATMGDNIEIVSITYEPNKIWKTNSAQHGISWHNWNDLKARGKDGIWARYGVTVSPTFFIISPEGIVLDRQVGYAEGLLMKMMSPTNLSQYNKETWEEQQEVLRLYEERLAEQAKSVTPGNNYKEIRCKGMDGEEIALSDVVTQNRYVLLDFWAASCAICMYEVPHLIEVYKQFHDKGFEIYALSLDKDSNTWRNTVKEKGMLWVNVLRESTEVSEQYGVRGVPSNFLIDCSTGKIVAVQLRSDALAAKLAELFEQTAN